MKFKKPSRVRLNSSTHCWGQGRGTDRALAGSTGCILSHTATAQHTPFLRGTITQKAPSWKTKSVVAVRIHLPSRMWCLWKAEWALISWLVNLFSPEGTLSGVALEIWGCCLPFLAEDLIISISVGSGSFSEERRLSFDSMVSTNLPLSGNTF